MEGFICIIVFVCAILNIILFFKVWRMTNDVHALREKYAPENKEKGKISKNKHYEDLIVKLIKEYNNVGNIDKVFGLPK